MAREFDTPPQGRALQWSDLSTGGRKALDANMRASGLNLSSNIAEVQQREKEKSVSGSTPATRSAGRKAAEALGAVQEHIVDKPVTVAHASTRRANLVKEAEQETPGDTPSGTGWYYRHHGEIAAAGHQHGVDPDRAITASAVMSPQNSPENEKAAVKGLMNTFSHHSVHVTPETAAHVKASSKGKVDISHHVGQTVRADQLPRGTVAHLSAPSFRDKVKGSEGIHKELYEVARGGTRDQNITSAERVLMGEVHPDEAINPHGAPKVWSYAHTIRNAVPNTSAHVEHVTRTRHNAMIRSGKISGEQGALDLYPGQNKNHPLLHENAHTVEDTWQNSISYGQSNELVGERGRTSVIKTAGSTPRVSYPPKGVGEGVHNYRTSKNQKKPDEPYAGPEAVLHAFNNRATQVGAKKLTEDKSMPTPPTAVQEVGWTQARWKAGKESEYHPPRLSELQTEAHAEHQARQAPAPGQQALFGAHVPGSSRIGGEPQGVHPALSQQQMTPAQQEKDLRKHEAMYTARRRRARG